MNVILQTTTVGASLFAALLLNAGSVAQTSALDLQKASEAWSASLAAEQSSNYPEALQQTINWHQAGGDAYFATLRTGWLQYLSQDYTKAAHFYNQAAVAQPNALNPQLGLLATAQALNDGAKIQSAADRVLKLEPTNYKALMAAANVYFATADYRKARGCYLRVLTSYPEDVDAMSGVAWSAFYIGDRSEAQKAFKKIAAVMPDYPSVQQGLELCAR